MKILITSGIFPPDIGGPASYVPKIASALSNRGHDVSVICLSESVDTINEPYEFKVKRIPRNMFYFFRILRTIYFTYLAAKKVDVIFANTLDAESAIAAFLARKPVVNKIVGDYAWERASNKGYYNETIEKYQTDVKRKIGLYFFDWITKLPYKYVDKIIVPSRFSQKLVSGWKAASKKNISIIYNSIDLSKIDSILPSPKSNSFTWVTICRLTNFKGVDEILKQLIKFPNDNLKIIGDGPLSFYLKKLCTELNLESRVKFCGNLSYFETIGELKSADVFILNSKGENFPNVILEAMACRVPVICTDVGGCSEIVEHLKTGFLIQLSEENQNIFQGLKLIRENKNLRDIIVDTSFNIIKKDFSFDQMVSETENVFLECVAN